MDNSMNEIENKSISLTQKRHKHTFEQFDNYMICPCGKKIMKLKNTDIEGILIGIKNNGDKYHVRLDRRRYFFPDEWIKFINSVTNKENKFLFLTCLHTGGRIMEVLNLRYKDIDEERRSVNFSIVKQRKAKRNYYATGKSRSFLISSEFIKEYKSYIRGKTFKPEDYIFLDNKKLPANFSDLDNSERVKYYGYKTSGYNQLLKRKLKSIGIKDYYNFSLHNIRKTYGMWMRAFNIEMNELCYRMGHDINTYINHYGSSLIFTDEERRKIAKILGDIR